MYLWDKTSELQISITENFTHRRQAFFPHFCSHKAYIIRALSLDVCAQWK